MSLKKQKLKKTTKLNASLEPNLIFQTRSYKDFRL